MKKEEMKIAISLSGGGVRAMLFHLGVLKFYAEKGLLEQIKIISSVSGGSLLIGIIYGANNNRWPSSDLFLRRTYRQCRKLLTEECLQSGSIWTLLKHPHWLFSRAKAVSHALEHNWGVNCYLHNINNNPMWIINSTTFETGKNWRFYSGIKMGDYKIGYHQNPWLKVSDAIASSASYPGLIDPLRLNLKNFNFGQSSEISLKQVHLWDGGLYDNLGQEAIFKQDRDIPYKNDCNFYIVSDASLPLPINNWNINPMKQLRRLINITMDQVRSLRSRTLMDYFRNNKNSGIYIQIGNTTSKFKNIDNSRNYLSANQVETASNHPTDLKKVSSDQFNLITRHGYEVAELTHNTYIDIEGLEKGKGKGK